MVLESYFSLNSSRYLLSTSLHCFVWVCSFQVCGLKDGLWCLSRTFQCAACFEDNFWGACHWDESSVWIRRWRQSFQLGSVGQLQVVSLVRPWSMCYNLRGWHCTSELIAGCRSNVGVLVSCFRNKKGQGWRLELCTSVSGWRRADVIVTSLLTRVWWCWIRSFHWIVRDTFFRQACMGF